MRYYLGVDLGGTNIVAGVADAGFRLLLGRWPKLLLNFHVPRLAASLALEIQAQNPAIPKARATSATMRLPCLSGSTKSARFDFSGFLLFGASMVLISIALEGMGEAEISKSRGALLVGLGLACLALYWLRAARIPAPLFQPSLFRIPAFSVGILGNVFSRLGSGAMPFLMPMYLQVGLGFTPLQSGLAMMPGAVASFTGKSLISRLIERFGLRKFLVFNTLAMGVMFCTFALNDARAHPAMLLAQLFVFGIFNSMQFTAMNTVTLFDLPDSQTGQGNSMLSVTMQISSSCGVAVAAALLGYFTAQFELVASFRSTFVCIGAISVVTCCIFSRLPAEVGRKQ